MRNRSASACHAWRVRRLGSDPKRTAAAAGDTAAANINRQCLHTRLRLVRYVLPEYVCAARHCYVAGQSAMQSQLHYVAARLQATLLTVGLPRGRYLGKWLGDPPANEAEHFIRCPACGGWINCRDLGQVLEHEGPLPHPPQDQPQ